MWRNTRTSYGWIAIALHWAVAAAFATTFALGWATQAVADEPATQFNLYQWHKSFGFLVLALALVRFGATILEVRPDPVLGLPAWQRRASGAMHALLLALLLAVPLAGWAVASASPLAIPSYVFELVVVPHLPLPKSAAMEAVASWAHAILAWTTCALVAGHAGAAVVHAVALRDGTLRRMLSPRG